MPNPDKHRKTGSFAQHASEKEKKRLSKELHDDLAQRMSVLKLDLEWLQQHLPISRPPSITQRLAGMRELLDNLISTTKSLATDLHPPLLDDFGLAATIDWFCSSFQKRTGIVCQTHYAGLVATPDDSTCSAIFRVLQEALSNVEHHSQAKQVQVRLSKLSDKICLHIRDNGKGMAKPEDKSSWGVGLLAMQERVDALDGTITVSNLNPNGLQIQVSFPA